MRKFLIAAAAVLAWSAAAQAAEVRNTSYVEPNGDRALQLSIDIAAPPATVWKGFVDEATLKRWNIPQVRVDLRAGGAIEEGFDAATGIGSGKSIHHQIVGYLPERLLVLRNISTPPGTPGGAVYPKIVQIVQLEPITTGTRVTLTGQGYGDDADFGRLYAFFAEHNPEYLVELKTFSETQAR